MKKEIPCFKGFYGFIDVFHKDQFTEEHAEYFDFKSFKLVLKSYYSGEYSRILNGVDNIDLLNEKFIVFELRDIKDIPEVLTIVMHIIIEIILEKFRRLKGIRKRVWIDEAWVTLKGEHSNFVEYLFRTCRKSDAGTGIITQNAVEIEDAGAVGKAIAGNCSGVFILDHTNNQQSIPALQNLFGLTPHSVGILNTIHNPDDNSYKEVMIKLNNTCRVYRVEVSNTARAVFTSKESEIIAIDKYAEIYGGNMQYMVAAYIEEEKLGGKV